MRSKEKVGDGNGEAERVSMSRRSASWRIPETNAPGVACSFGATCVGVLLQRMRLHLATQRFLAERRGDRIWEASCDYAALSLERIGARLRPGMFEQPLFPKNPRRALRKRRKARGRR